MTLQESVKNTVELLAPRYGRGEARAMTEMMWEHLKGYKAVDLVLKADTEVSDFISGKVSAIVDRLLAGEPLQYILGEAWWHGLRIKVTPDVLIPRPETSELVDLIADRYKSISDLEVLDLCTGSGCIAVALAAELPFSAVTGVDISSRALDVARENGKSQKVRVRWIEADVMSLDLKGEYDIIVSNPPYVLESEKETIDPTVKDHEPGIALWVPDSDPLRFYHAIINVAPRLLKPGSGRIYFEINPLEASALCDDMRAAGWRDVTVVKDTHGKDRFLIAEIPE